MVGNQVYIRILEKSDIPSTHKWINDPVLGEIMGYIPAFPLVQQEQYFDKLINDKSRMVFAICLKDDHTHIGNVALGNIDYIHRHAMFSIFIENTQKRGRGIGSETTRLMLDFAFNRLNLNKIYLRTSERFVEAIAMYKKLGFAKEGVWREHYYTNGKYEDKHLYSILRREYLPG